MSEVNQSRIFVLCPYCGERLSADPSCPAAICPFCGGRFPVQRAGLVPEAKPPASMGDSRRGRSADAGHSGNYEEKPRRKKRGFLRFLLACVILFLAGRAVLPVLNVLLENERRKGETRSPSAAAVTAAPRPTVTPGPAVTARPASTPRPAATATPAPSPSAGLSGVTPEFREAMDSYEAFFDEYIAFMQGLGQEDDGLAFLLRYAEMLGRYEEAMEAMDAIDEDSLSTADELYYLEVLSRISEKLLAVSSDGQDHDG